jgi:hypothetical protein
MSDWTEAFAALEKAKEANTALRQAFDSVYESTKSSGLDHEETCALMRGLLKPMFPAFWPLMSLWLRRKKP